MSEPPVPNWPRERLEHELFIAPQRAFVPRPDTRVVERPGWTHIITPGLVRGGINEVVHCDLAPDAVESAIDGAFREFGQHGLRWRWKVTPLCRPSDLAQRLERRGLNYEWLHGIVRATGSTEFPRPEHTGGVALVDQDNVDDFACAMAAGWGTDVDVGYHRRLVEQESPLRMFVAYVDGNIAGAASYFAFPESAHFLGGVVLPPYRRHGIYRALVHTRLAHAHRDGLGLATGHAREGTSFPILGKLGFCSLARFPVFFAS